jgi:hypothetical protein
MTKKNQLPTCDYCGENEALFLAMTSTGYIASHFCDDSDCVKASDYDQGCDFTAPIDILHFSSTGEIAPLVGIRIPAKKVVVHVQMWSGKSFKVFTALKNYSFFADNDRSDASTFRLNSSNIGAFSYMAGGCGEHVLLAENDPTPATHYLTQVKND